MTIATAAVLPDFDLPQLAEAVERLPPEALDALPFGAIRLDTGGVVRLFSDTERHLPGYQGAALGRLFSEIAPGMDLGAVRDRIERALAAGRLDLALDHVGEVDERTTELRVRLQSATDGGCWIFVRREG